jgi:hypothetical protein
MMKTLLGHHKIEEILKTIMLAIFPLQYEYFPMVKTPLGCHRIAIFLMQYEYFPMVKTPLGCHRIAIFYYAI